MNTPLHMCMAKGTTAEGDQMQYGPNWVLSRRGTLKIFEDRLECGDWKIQYSDISGAILYSIRAAFFIPGYILTIHTRDKTYHFGLNGGSFWRGQLPFAVRREKGKMTYSNFSIVVRLLMVGYLGYLLWTRISL